MKHLLKWAIGLVVMAIVVFVGVYVWSQNHVNFESVKILLPDHTELTLEIAESAPQLSKGLSGRASLDQNHGIIFLFEESAQHRFWMKEMEFPLDFIWLEGESIVELRANVGDPLTVGKILDVVPDAPFNRVIEVNAGTIKKHHLTIGQTINLDAYLEK